MFDQLREDYKRHDSRILNPPFWAICNYRLGKWALRVKLSPLRWFASKLYGLNMFLIQITSGIGLHRETKIGKDFHLIHAGNIKIHPYSVIGDRCGIMHDVTIGTNFIPGRKIGFTIKTGTPIIGNDVFIGTGAKILGEITIGDNVIIGANSLVTKNVPSDCLAIGVPAKVFRIKRQKKQRFQI
jgi:serine O-acetyltransferase